MVTGKLMSQGDVLVVRTELVDVMRQSQIWGERYTRKGTVRDDTAESIARDISEKVGQRLSRR